MQNVTHLLRFSLPSAVEQQYDVRRVWCVYVLHRVVQRLSASDAAAEFQRRMSAASNSERTEFARHSAPARRHRPLAAQHHPLLRTPEERELYVRRRRVNDTVLRVVDTLWAVPTRSCI